MVSMFSEWLRIDLLNIVRSLSDMLRQLRTVFKFFSSVSEIVCWKSKPLIKQ